MLGVVMQLGCSSSDSNLGQTTPSPDAQAGGQSGQSGSGGTPAGNGGAPASGGASGAGGTVAGGTAGIGGSSANVTNAEACSAYLDAYCGWVARCDVLVLRDYWDTVAQCKEANTAECLDSFTAPGSAWTVAGTMDCAEKVSAAECALVISRLCPVHGSLADGAACRYDGQCASGVCQRTDWFLDCGHCAEPGVEGASCHQLNGCVAGFECSLGGDTRDTCVRGNPVGAACDFYQSNCAYGLGCTNGTCKTLPGAGETCSPQPYECDPSQDVECLGGTCVKLQWVHEGEACDAGKAILCVGDLTCTNGTCAKGTPTVPTLAADCK